MTYPSIEAADVIAARNAYANDMAVDSGMCAICKDRQRDEGHRKCWTCRHEGRVEVPRS